MAKGLFTCSICNFACDSVMKLVKLDNFIGAVQANQTRSAYDQVQRIVELICRLLGISNG